MIFGIKDQCKNLDNNSSIKMEALTLKKNHRMLWILFLLTFRYVKNSSWLRYILTGQFISLIFILSVAFENQWYTSLKNGFSSILTSSIEWMSLSRCDCRRKEIYVSVLNSSIEWLSQPPNWLFILYFFNQLAGIFFEFIKMYKNSYVVRKKSLCIA